MKLIAIHSMPRSGSTWLGSIIDSCPNVSYKMQPLFSYALKGSLKENSTLEEINSFKIKLLDTKDSFIDQTESKEKGTVPTFEKAKISCVAYKETRYHFILQNLLQKDQEARLIGLIRNPLAHLNSWFKAPKEFETDWKIEEEWRTANNKNKNNIEEYYGFEKWKEVAFMFHKLKSDFLDRVFILNYGELIKEPIKKTKELFSFFDLPYSEQTENFLITSRMYNNEDPYGVYKSKKNDESWRSDFPDFIKQEVYFELKGTVLERYLK